MLDQITDAVTQTNVKVVGEAPTMAMGTSYLTAAHSTGLLFHNSVNSQNNQFMTAQTGTIKGVLQIYGRDQKTKYKSVEEVVEAARRFV